MKIRDVKEFTTRIKNCLRRNGYENMSEIENFSKEKFLKMRNLGEKSVRIILKVIKEKPYNKIDYFL